MAERNNGNDMSTPPFDEEMCERYLFGELNEAEQERFEDAYFNDDAFFDRFLAVKTELLDLYARGELGQEKVSRMEPHFMATAPRQRRIAESAEFISSISAVAARRETSPGVIAAPAPHDENVPGLIDRFLGLFTIPRLAAVAGLLLAVVGGTLLLDRANQAGSDEIAAVQPDPQPGPPTASTEMPTAAPQPQSNLAADPESARDALPPARSRAAKKLDPSAPVAARVSGESRTSVRDRNSGPEPVPTPRRAPEAADQPVNERAATGFAITLSTVGRDNGRPVGAAPTSGLNVGGQRAREYERALTYSITLRSGATRATGDTSTLVLPNDSDTRPASIHMIFRSEPYPDYVVTISGVDGSIVLKEDDLEVASLPDGSRLLTLWIENTRGFAPGDKDYLVKLEGKSAMGLLETIDEYYFNVDRVAAKSSPSDKNLGGSQKLDLVELGGMVLDPNGAGVPNAVVSLREIKTGLRRAVTATPNGTYRVAELPPGTYEVAAEAPTLKRSVIPNVSVARNETLVIPMQPGSQDAIVSVEGVSAIVSKLVLRPSMTKTLRMFRDTEEGELLLILPRLDYVSFDISVRTSRGRRVATHKDLTDLVDLRLYGGIPMTFQRKILLPGGYIIRVSGSTKEGPKTFIGEYRFKVRYAQGKTPETP